MPRTGRPKSELVLSAEEREQVTRWSRRAKSSQALALRSKIVLACAEGTDNKTVAEQLGCARVTVGKWRARFVEHRLDGLTDEQRTGRPATISVDQVEDVVIATLESTPPNATHWSRAKMAQRTGLSKTTIGEIWRKFELKPHRVDHFKLSNDPLFIDKLYDVVGLYLNPPEAAVVLCVDEKSQVQALQRSQPALPMMPGMPERRTHDYIRHGTTTLFAALDIATGQVTGALKPRHRHQEFLAFLKQIERAYRHHLDVDGDPVELHLVMDNYAAHKHTAVRAWLVQNPRFVVHFTPTHASWMNLVEVFFSIVERQAIRRGVFKSVKDLNTKIRAFLDGWNDRSHPFVWTKTAEEILKKANRPTTSNPRH